MSKTWRSLVACALLVCIVAVVAGCGSDSDSGSSGTTASTEAETTGGEGGTAAQEEAKEFVEENSDLENLDWPEPPDEPYDPGKGKIGIIIAGAGGSGSVEMGKEAVRAAKAAGWEPTEPLDGQFTPSVASGLVQQLVAEKVDAIYMDSTQPENIASAVNAATEAGIPIACAYCQSGPEFKSFGGPVPMVTQNGVEGGEFVAAYIGANSEGPTSVKLVGDDPAFPILVERSDGLEQGLEKYCPECEFETVKLTAAELAEPGPPAFSALLSKNPPGTLDWVVGGPADPFGGLMMNTAEQQGRTEIQMVGMDAAPEVLENLSKGGVTKADTIAGYRYAAWAAVEQAIRQSVGLKPWKADNMPHAFITKDNVADTLAQLPQYYQPPAFDYEKMFEELWSGK